jgi:hypothetical protein
LIIISVTYEKSCSVTAWQEVVVLLAGVRDRFKLKSFRNLKLNIN